MSMTSKVAVAEQDGCHARERARCCMLSRLGMLIFIALPVVVVALGVAVAAVLALGWVIQHVIA
jgi:hypothetical protein